MGGSRKSEGEGKGHGRSWEAGDQVKGMRAVGSVIELKKAGSGSGYEIVYQPKGIASS